MSEEIKVGDWVLPIIGSGIKMKGGASEVKEINQETAKVIRVSKNNTIWIQEIHLDFLRKVNRELSEEKLMRIRKEENRGATGELYNRAKETKDIKLVKEINRILKIRRKVEG